MEARLVMRKRAIKRMIIIALALAWAVIAIFAAIAHLASVTALPMSATAWIYTGLVVAMACLGWGFYRDLSTWYPGEGFGNLAFMTPLAIASVWGGLWPAMKYWAFSGPGPLWMYQQLASGAGDIPVYWWGNVYTQYLGFMAILVVGYAIVIKRWMYN